jgi:heme/copper-type cytochrome/quinol oxidase subunit 3
MSSTATVLTRNAPHSEGIRSIPIGKIGIWWLLASEIMVFGGLITSYVLLRISHGGWAEQAAHVRWQLGTLNTAVLLTSSLTMALALSASRQDRRRRTATFLLLTVLLGVAFLGIKAFEYTGELREGFTPASGLFWSFYYGMTGLHALHVTAGIVVNLTFFVMAVRGDLWDGKQARLEYAGLYWHFVDVVWIFLFPLLYLS